VPDSNKPIFIEIFMSKCFAFGLIGFLVMSIITEGVIFIYIIPYFIFIPLTCKLLQYIVNNRWSIFAKILLICCFALADGLLIVASIRSLRYLVEPINFVLMDFNRSEVRLIKYLTVAFAIQFLLYFWYDTWHKNKGDRRIQK